MRALITPMLERLKAAPQLTGWAMRKYTDTQERQSTPAVEIRFAQAQAEDSENRPVGLVPVYAVRLVHRNSDDSDALLDAALKAVISRLHNWHPNQIGEKFYGRIALIGVQEDPYREGGYDSYLVSFTSSTTFHGCSFSDQ